jgi:hypothetical protein
MEKVKAYFSIQGRRKLFYLLLAMMSFVILDGVITEILIAQGKAYEANAFLAPMIGGISFMLLKVFGAVLCAVILWDISKRHEKLASIAAWIATVGYGIIVIWNTSLYFLA